jgi:hypothetical protein
MDDWIEVPHERISDTTLQSLLEEACTRDGTEMTDATLKVEQLRDGSHQAALLSCPRLLPPGMVPATHRDTGSSLKQGPREDPPHRRRGREYEKRKFPGGDLR